MESAAREGGAGGSQAGSAAPFLEVPGEAVLVKLRQALECYMLSSDYAAMARQLGDNFTDFVRAVTIFVRRLLDNEGVHLVAELCRQFGGSATALVQALTIAGHGLGTFEALFRLVFQSLRCPWSFKDLCE